MIASYAKINEIDLYYELHGQGDPLLLLHGAFGSLEMFRELIPRLASDFQVIAVDSRGHGRSTDGDSLLSYSLMASDMARLLEELQLGPAIVVGWSDGGITGLELAIRCPAHVRKLVAMSVNSSPSGLTQQAIETTYSTSAETLDPFTVSFYRKVSPHPEHLPILVEKVKYMLLTEPNLTPDQLGRIVCPTLIIAGEEEECVRTEHILKLWSAIPGAKLEWIAEAGHFIWLDQPAKVTKIISEFLKPAQRDVFIEQLTPQVGR